MSERSRTQLAQKGRLRRHLPMDLGRERYRKSRSIQGYQPKGRQPNIYNLVIQATRNGRMPDKAGCIHISSLALQAMLMAPLDPMEQPTSAKMSTPEGTARVGLRGRCTLPIAQRRKHRHGDLHFWGKVPGVQL